MFAFVGAFSTVLQSFYRSCRINLGDGQTRAEGGERLKHAIMSNDRAWKSWGSTRPWWMTGRFSEDHQRPALPRRPPVWMKNLSVTFPDKRPDRPPELAPGKNWFYVGPDDVSWGTSGRRLTVSCSENDVVFFRKGCRFQHGSLSVS